MIKKTRFIYGILALLFVWCSIPHFYIYGAETIPQGVTISGSLLKKTNGVVSLTAQDNRSTNYLDMTEYPEGQLTISFGSNAYGAVVFSDVDLPEDVVIGYTFISTDFYSINSIPSVTLDFPGYSYVYVSKNKNYTATFVPKDSPVDPTPTFTPTPTPASSVGDNIDSSIYFHFDVPLDYYLILMIIILGGIFICLFFRN